MPVFTVIDHTEFTTGTTEYQKTSISQDYDHLLLKASVRSEAVAENDRFTIKLNLQDSGVYNVTDLVTSTVSPTSGTEGGYTNEMQCGMTPAANATADTFGPVTMWIPHYSNTDNFKQVLVTQAFPNVSNTDGEWQISTRAVLFRHPTDDTRAITAIQVRRNASDFAQYSTFTLYGITGA